MLDATWEEQFVALVAYREQHGNCNVPLGSSENPQLSKWVSRQRRPKTRRSLAPDRTARLEALGFAWNPLEAAWEEQFATLVAYREQHGKCDVPAAYPDNSALATWVSTQRSSKKKDTLSPDRIGRLDALGFAWNPFDATWEDRFALLVTYRQQYGDCNVSQHFRQNRALGQWVSAQRTRKTDGLLSADRIARLDALGFVWRVTKPGA